MVTKPYYQEPDRTIYCGHAIDVLRELEPESVDMCMTSPPYWGLRSYKTEPQIWDSKDGCRHEWVTEIFKQHAGRGDCQSSKKYSEQEAIPDMKLDRQFCSLCGAWRGELGLEPTIELYIKHLIQIFNEVNRVLKKTGTCWVNLDDSYAGGKGQSGCGDPEYQENRTDATLNKPYHQMGGHGLTRPADGKIGVPAKSLCLIPSRFALAMVESGWILRNDIAWNKPNPMPESVKDRFTGSWEHLFFFAKSKRYFFEQQFEPILPQSLARLQRSHFTDYDPSYPNEQPQRLHKGVKLTSEEAELITGRNMRDVWEITTQPTVPVVIAGNKVKNFATFPEKLCETPILAGCPQDGVVLEPFCGSGTTLVAAKKLGRKAIGIDISPNYCKLTVKRLQEIPMPMELA